MAKREMFAQLGYLSVTETAANTLTFAGLSVFSNVLGQKGMVIHRASYTLDTTAFGNMVGDGDGVTFGLSGDDSMTSITFNDAEIYDYNMLDLQYIGTAANSQQHYVPFVKDYTGLPGGGLLVPADRLYVYVKGHSAAGAIEIKCRFHYTIMDLSAQEYLELAQAMRVLK